MRASPGGTRRCAAGEDGGPEGTGPPPSYRGGRSPGAPSRKRSTRARPVRRCKGRRRAVGPEPLQRGAGRATAPTAAPQGLAGASARPRRAGAAYRRRRGRRPHRLEVGPAVRPVWMAERHRSAPSASGCRHSRPPAASGWDFRGPRPQGRGGRTRPQSRPGCAVQRHGGLLDRCGGVRGAPA